MSKVQISYKNVEHKIEPTLTVTSETKLGTNGNAQPRHRAGCAFKIRVLGFCSDRSRYYAGSLAPRRNYVLEIRF